MTCYSATTERALRGRRRQRAPSRLSGPEVMAMSSRVLFRARRAPRQSGLPEKGSRLAPPSRSAAPHTTTTAVRARDREAGLEQTRRGRPTPAFVAPMCAAPRRGSRLVVKGRLDLGHGGGQSLDHCCPRPRPRWGCADRSVRWRKSLIADGPAVPETATAVNAGRWKQRRRAATATKVRTAEATPTQCRRTNFEAR